MNWEQLLSLQTQAEREEEPKDFGKYPLNDLEKDYKAIISSVEFRRLQDKTQVFPLDKSDFVRTRLTHSIEVSTIAKQLGIMVTQNRTGYLQEDFKTNPDIVEKIPVVLSCAGLLHDLGNPPFGHFGEVVIGEWFADKFADGHFTYLGRPVSDWFDSRDERQNRNLRQMKNDLRYFEGNAQAFRILSKIQKRRESSNINLTAGVLSSLIKYPVDSVSFEGKGGADIRKHKPGYYYSERAAFEKISRETGTLREDGEVSRHPLAFLMEAADDIAYATADLEDAFQKELFTLDEFVKFFSDEVDHTTDETQQKYSMELLIDLKKRLEGAARDREHDMIAFQHWMELVRKWFMYVTAYSFSRNYTQIMEGVYLKEMTENTHHTGSIRIMKSAMKKFGYEAPEIVKLELSARKIINGLLDDFVPAVLYYGEEEQNANGICYKQSQVDLKFTGLIPENIKSDYLEARTDNPVYNLYLRFLMVTDFISGMTDSYAKNLYQSLNGIE